MNKETKWQELKKELAWLQKADEQEEPEGLSEAYGTLLKDYQCSRELNLELEELADELTHLLYTNGIAF